MFKKIVSNLNFSPALVGQLGFYAKRLKKEEATRRVGLIFVALALVVQSFSVFSPPESANAASGNNIIYGGIRDKNDLIGMYDRNSDSAGHTDLQQVYSYFGITRQDIVNGSIGSFNSRDQNLSIQSVGRSTYSWQRDPHAIPGTSTTVYSSLTYKFDSQPYTIQNGSTYRALIGTRASDGGWFAIMLDCGNAAYITLPPPPPPPPPPAPVVPSAECTGLTITPMSRTVFRLTGTAAVKNGAGVTAYRYTVKNINNEVVASPRLTGDGLSAPVDVEIKADGNYSASVIVETTVGEKTGSACKKAFTVSAEPKAACSGLTLKPINRTTYRLTANSQAEGGASVLGYRFAVKNASGTVVASERLNGDGLTAAVDFDLKKDGVYTASVTVETTLGDRNGNDCKKNLTVSPEPRCVINPDFIVGSPECKPCENDSTIWYKDKDCIPVFDVTKKVKNITQLIDNADNTTAKTSDTLEYKLTVKNTGKKTDTFVIKDNIGDVLEYADLVDGGGGTLNTAGLSIPVEKVGMITWPAISIKPGQTITKIINVKVKATIPPTPQSPSNPESYNCRMVNDFSGNNTIVMVECPKEKVVEQVITQLPHTGASENMLFAAGILSITVYFYARTRQVKKEVRLIRRDLNSGTI